MSELDKNSAISTINNQKGQTFVEFLFLLLILVGMSFTMLRVFNGGIGERWKALVMIIAKPTSTQIELR